MSEAHIDTATPNQEPGISKQSKGHFQLCDVHGRVLMVMDLGGGISFGGVYITDPAVLAIFGERVSAFASVLQARQERGRH